MKIQISYMEIYNENVNDLLDPSKKNLKIREDRSKGEVVVDGLSKFEVTSVSEIMQYIKKGNDIKIIAEHKMSDQSSRSHTVYKIEVMVMEKNTQTSRKIINSSEINLVDLAGSEGVAKMQL